MKQTPNTKIAFTHLTSRVKQTLVATLSVTFGISMYIFMNGFMSGVNETQSEMAFSTLAHVRIYNDLPEDRSKFLDQAYPEETAFNIRNTRIIQYTEGIRNSAAIREVFAQDPDLDCFTGQVNLNVFFRNGATRKNGSLSGIEVAKEDELFGTSQYMVEGDWDALQYRGDGIIMGIGLARKLGLGYGDNVRVQTGDGVNKNFKVIGILETTLAGVDNSKAYVRISTARQLESKNQGYVTDLMINLRDYDRAEAFASRYKRLIPYKTEAWQEANGQLDAANELRNIIALAVSLTILIVAGFGIYNIMNMTVNEKIKEIAILKAMGFQGRDIVQIFLLQSVFIGILGGIMGVILGLVISMIIGQVPFEFGPLETLPIVYHTQDYVLAFAFGLLTTFIAGYLPARKASEVDPVSIIRG